MGWFSRKRKRQKVEIIVGETGVRPPRPNKPPRPDPGVPQMQLVRLGCSGRVNVVGESHYQDAIAAAAGGRELSGGEDEARCRAVLIPEPNNPHDANAVRVAVQGKTVGYLSREAATDYQPVLMDLHTSGRLGWCHARIAGGGQRYCGVFLELSEPEALVPANDPGGLSILTPDRTVAVTRRQDHQDVLHNILGARSDAMAYASLASSTIATGKYQGHPCIEVRIDGHRIGEFSQKMSERYLESVGVREDLGCEVVLRKEGPGVHAAALMPRPDS